MMAKTAYLIASDLHLNYKNLRNRINYRDEVMVACKKLISIGTEYKNKGYRVVLLLLGDVFNRSYNDIFNACTDNNFFYVWNLKFGEIYSVLGNHELSYYSANPFYTLLSNIESEKVRGILNKVWEPVGSSGVIHVVDRLDDGNVSFLFNHYGTGIATTVDGNTNIGLFHQDIVCSEVVQASSMNYDTTTYGVPVDIEGSRILDNYDYCFFGHMHTVYGTYRTGSGTILCYLASLGRTNVNEINNKFLQRNIPVICVEDGNLAGAYDNFFDLPSWEASVKEDKIAESKQKAEVEKERKIIKTGVSLSDDSIQNVLTDLASNELASSVFRDLLSQQIDSYGAALLKEMNEVLLKQLV